MMMWPYHFVSLDADQIAIRTELLGRYGSFAQLSALVPVLVYQLYRLGVWVFSERQRAKSGYTRVPSTPGSPQRKKQRQSSPSVLRRQWRSLTWWLEGEVRAGWGLRGHWIAVVSWASWLLFLAVSETGDGSQFPVHYMLSMKSVYSPFALAFQASHEELNPYHRLSGRIIYTFLILHATFYMNFFVQAGLVVVRLTQLVPLLGVLAFTLITILASTSLETVRRWSYRVFFICHLIIGIAILPILFFHAAHIRLYVAESLILFVLDLLARKLDTVTGFSKITSVADTNLVKLVIPVPESKIGRFDHAAGQHVYLSIPRESTPTSTRLPSIHEILFNPFTVADVSTRDITLVVRTLSGPTTTALDQLTKLSKATPGINIEGPLGSARNFPNFAAKFDRILLVAGGVGSTFILPIYRQIISSVSNEGNNASRVELIWAMRSLAEAGWLADTENAELLETDDRIKIYVTGTTPGSSESSVADSGPTVSGVEMNDLTKKKEGLVSGGYKRPNLEATVDKTFGYGEEERVAVLVCGPSGLAGELRRNVEKWALKGRDIWWHNEAFGW